FRRDKILTVCSAEAGSAPRDDSVAAAHSRLARPTKPKPETQQEITEETEVQRGTVFSVSSVISCSDSLQAPSSLRPLRSPVRFSFATAAGRIGFGGPVPKNFLVSLSIPAPRVRPLGRTRVSTYAIFFEGVTTMIRGILLYGLLLAGVAIS